MEEKYFEITPNKKVYGVLSHVGYSLKDSIAELIDNSIDSRIEKKILKIEVYYDPHKEALIIKDNGSGMNEKTLKKAITLAESQKRKGLSKQLGFFGIGLKSASLSIGKKFEVKTKILGSTKQYSFEFDIDDWEKHGDWKKFPYTEDHGFPRDESGTTIIIKDLKPRLVSKPRLSRLRDSFSLRYEQFFKTENVELWIQHGKCIPKSLQVLMEEHTSLKTPFGEIELKLQLNPKRAAKGVDFGFHLYRAGRLIESFSKMGWKGAHVEKSVMTGTIILDFVPSLFTKSSFQHDSPEYRGAEEKLEQYLTPKRPYFSTRYLNKKSGVIDAILKLQEQSGKIMNYNEYKKFVIDYAGKGSLDSKTKNEEMLKFLKKQGITLSPEKIKAVERGELNAVDAVSGKVIKDIKDKEVAAAIKGAKKLEIESNSPLKKNDIEIKCDINLFGSKENQYFNLREKNIFFIYKFVKSDRNYFVDYEEDKGRLNVLINENFPLFEENLKESRFFILSIVANVITRYIIANELLDDDSNGWLYDHILKQFTKSIMKSQMNQLR